MRHASIYKRDDELQQKACLEAEVYKDSSKDSTSVLDSNPTTDAGAKDLLLPL